MGSFFFQATEKRLHFRRFSCPPGMSRANSDGADAMEVTSTCLSPSADSTPSWESDLPTSPADCECKQAVHVISAMEGFKSLESSQGPTASSLPCPTPSPG